MLAGCRIILVTLLATSLAAAAAVAADSQERAESLRAAIARDRERLKVLVSEPASEGPARTSARVELREIAHRLPGLQRELSAAEVDAEPAPAPE